MHCVRSSGSTTKASALGNPSAGWKPSISAAGALGFVLMACSGPSAPSPPPSGGQTLDLDFEMFANSVLPILNERGCNAAGDCHGGGIRGSFELSPLDAIDPAFDFDQASQQVFPWAREESPLLTKPLALAAGGAPHSAKPFASREDPGFITIQDWIDAGELR